MVKKNKSYFANNVRALRIANGLTQNELANKVGVTRDCVKKWESGCSMPFLLTTAKLAHELGCSIDELMKSQFKLVAVKGGQE